MLVKKKWTFGPQYEDSTQKYNTTSDQYRWTIYIFGFAISQNRTDMGITPEEAIRCQHVFITHPHIDHIAGIVRHCSTREMMSMDAPTYYIGEEHRNAFEDMMDSWRRLNRSFLPYKIETMHPKRQIEINNQYFIRAFRSVHKVPHVWGICFMKSTQTKI